MNFIHSKKATEFCALSPLPFMCRLSLSCSLWAFQSVPVPVCQCRQGNHWVCHFLFPPNKIFTPHICVCCLKHNFWVLSLSGFILDLCGNRPVAFEYGDHNDNQIVFKTFDKAITTDPDAKPIFHSDRDTSIPLKLSGRRSWMPEWPRACRGSADALIMDPWKAFGEPWSGRCIMAEDIRQGRNW